MNETLTRGLFDRHVRSKFHVEAGETAVVCELIECRRLLESQPLEDGQREPFSLLFRGPSAPVLPQQVYSVRHDELGAIEMFLVPIGPDKQGMRYEAIYT